MAGGGKGFISELDVSGLLRRYTTGTILALLHEISSSADTKLNWAALVKTSNSGITNAREYQSLWRNLAYRMKIPDSFEDDTEVLEDDSDLEFEVEPVPPVNHEVAAEVAACVKVLDTTGTSVNGSSKSQEPCFIIEIPNSTSGWKVKGNGQVSNVMIPGSHTSETQPARKKRKLWTSEEDQELIAAVEKCGEGNWANMLKSAFRHERTAAQLSQRWALIRKRRDTQTATPNNVTENQSHATATNAGGNQALTDTTNCSQTADPQRTVVPSQTAGLSSANNTSAPALQEQVSSQTPNTQNATSLPQQPVKGKAPIRRSGIAGVPQGRLTNPITTPVTAPSSAVPPAGGDARQGKSVAQTSVSLPGGSPLPSRYNVSAGVRNNTVTSVGRATPKTSAGPDPMVQAAAVAAGARIAPASAAASLLKAAQSGNVVHIGLGGVPMGKSGAQNQTGSSAAGSSMKVAGGTGSRTPGGTMVHYIRTGTRSPQSIPMAGQRAAQLKGQVTRASSSQVMQPTIRPCPSNLSPGNLSAPALMSQKMHPTSSTTVTTEKIKPSLQSVLPSDSQGAGASDTLLRSSDSVEGNKPTSSDALPHLDTGSNQSSSLPNTQAPGPPKGSIGSIDSSKSEISGAGPIVPNLCQSTVTEGKVEEATTGSLEVHAVEKI